MWKIVKTAQEEAGLDEAVHQIGQCPSGRLVALDNNTGTAIVQRIPVEIVLVDDLEKECAGPLWLRGQIAVIAADGTSYEPRDRVTLCRCGYSANKPFCDGSHVAASFCE